MLSEMAVLSATEGAKNPASNSATNGQQVKRRVSQFVGYGHRLIPHKRLESAPFDFLHFTVLSTFLN